MVDSSEIQSASAQIMSVEFSEGAWKNIPLSNNGYVVHESKIVLHNGHLLQQKKKSHFKNDQIPEIISKKHKTSISNFGNLSK